MATTECCAFPTGAFSHSLGLEAAIQLKVAVTKEDFRTFALAVLENSGSKYIPFVLRSHQTCLSLAELTRLDDFCETCIINHVERKASLRQGHSFLETSSKTFRDKPFLSSLYNSLQSGDYRGHLAVVFGAVCGCMALDLEDSLEMFLYTSLKTVVAAAVRLGYLGAMEAQQVQYDLQGHIPDVIKRNRDRELEDICTRHPTTDVIQNIQDTLFSKLFYS